MSFQLFSRVPSVYRVRDAQIAASMTLLTPAEQAELATLEAQTTPYTADQQALFDELTAKKVRGPLQSLLMVIDEQLSAFAEDLDQLYDDQFIETCAPWVIPYIGDLIGYQSIVGITPAVDNPRSEVADTISMRRRKGTVLVLEQLARDVTGWGAHALEFFQLLADTQYMKHVRRHNYYSPDVRGWQPRVYRNSAFSKMTHKVDVHNVAPVGLPRFNIQNLGIFLWSLGAYRITQGTPATAEATGSAVCLRLNSLGMDMPLFHPAVSQGEDITAAAQPWIVPDRLRREVLCADMQNGAGSHYYGQGAALALYLNGQLLSPYQIQIADLSGADGAWINAPASGNKYSVLLDPELGRVALPPPASGSSAPTLTATYFYGSNGEIGGGEYEREDTFVVSASGPDPGLVLPFPDTASAPRYISLQDALTFAVNQLATEGQVALEISGSQTYAVSTAGTITVDLPAGTTLELRGQDQSRPTLLLDGELQISGDKNSNFILNGLLIGASTGMMPGSPPAALVHVLANRPDTTANLLSQLTLTDCTLVPGWAVDGAGAPAYPNSPGLIVEPAGVQIFASRCILGAIQAADFATVSLADTILDATSRSLPAYSGLDGISGGGALTMTGCTVVGMVHVTVLTLVSDSIVWGVAANGWASALIADRRQAGCVRFSYLPVNAMTPRRFECVEQALAYVQPIFFSPRYGAPGYLKMLACTDNKIRRGADDGGEMGAFHFLLAPLRETDLNVRLQEYVPVGLTAGLIYQT